MTVLGSPNELIHSALGSESDESLDQMGPTSSAQPHFTAALISRRDRSRPLSSATIGTAVTIIRPNNFAMRFSGAPGHPVHPRHFLKEFRIAMRDLGVSSDKEQIEAFEDYLVVDSPAEKWYFSVRDTYTSMGVLGNERPWNTFQIDFQARFPGETFVDPAATVSSKDSTMVTTDTRLNAIKYVKFRQGAAVSAYIKATWKMGPTSQSPRIESPKLQTETGSDSEVEDLHSLKLGKFKPIATEEIFELSSYGIPNGAQVRFTSHVWGVGGMYFSLSSYTLPMYLFGHEEYSSEDDQWFTHDITATKGADFRQ